MRKTVWITGAAGFSGRYLVQFLRSLRDPVNLVGLGRRPASIPELGNFYQVDLTDGATVRKILQLDPPNRVIHLAGLLPPSDEAELWRVNVGGTQTLLQTLANNRTRDLRVLIIGSAAEYLPSSANLKETDPCGGGTPYGRTKWAQSMVALACGKELGLDVVVARTFNLLGPGLPSTLVAGGLCAQFSRNEGEPIKVGNLWPLRDFIDVRDAVSAYWRICERGRRGETYNVCSGRATRIRTIVRMFSDFTGRKLVFEQDCSRSRPSDLDRSCGSNSKLRRLGWSSSIPLRQSIRDMLEWSRSQ